ncbi:MAG TPA: GNAT family N-acetyltransferase, partial [bacterium]|nr:GNAT family N-acetyltransferase [bacterium]
MNNITYRRARPSDTRPILNLINVYSAKGVMLPRPYAQVMDKIRDFVVAVDESTPQGALKGIVAMHVVGEDLAEIRSLAVEEALQGNGIGKKLLEFCL